MFVNITFFARFGIGYDTACHSARNLTCHDFHAFGSFDYYGATLVVGTCFRQPGLHELTVLVRHRLHGSVYRVPVGMHIDQTHKYGNHDTAVMEIFGLFNFFHYHNLPVSGSDHNLFSLFLTEQTYRATEEVYQDSINYKADDGHYIERNLAFQTEIKSGVYGKYQQQTAGQCMCAFAVNAYFL